MFARASTKASPLIVLVLLSACGLGSQEPASSSRSIYRKEVGRTIDEARVGWPRGASVAQLKFILDDFVRSDCTSRSLGRLIFGATEADLVPLRNSSILDLNLGMVRDWSVRFPEFLGRGVSQLQVAQVVCLGGSATALIRVGTTVTRYQLTGESDTELRTVGGLSYVLQGFNLFGPVDGHIWGIFFIRVATLPTLDEALNMRKDLVDLVNVPIALNVRTDPFFWAYDGPRFDPFQVPVPRLSGEQFLNSPYISCPLSNREGACEQGAFAK